jgi:hypothetical protein
MVEESEREMKRGLEREREEIRRRKNRVVKWDEGVEERERERERKMLEMKKKIKEEIWKKEETDDVIG